MFLLRGLWNHSRSTCPARDSICKACGIKGHYSRVCRKGKGSHRSWSDDEPESDSASDAFLASAVTKDPPVNLASATLPIVV